MTPGSVLSLAGGIKNFCGRSALVPMMRFNIFKAFSGNGNTNSSRTQLAGPNTATLKPKSILLNGTIAAPSVPLTHSQPSPVLSPLYQETYNDAYSLSGQTPYLDSNNLHHEAQQYPWSPIPSVERSDSERTKEHEHDFHPSTQRTHNTGPFEHLVELRHQLPTENSMTSRNVRDNASRHHPNSMRYASESTRTMGYAPVPRDLQPDTQASKQRRTAVTTSSHYAHRPEMIEPVIYEHDPWPTGDPLEPEVYHYIIPSGVEVVFKDEDGNEITR
ncbi:hypothetical protein BDQ17DRAFT_1423347 [Cyathus striatus]|nr:hypothetical protein BDQ17DRAFT_1441478 [Cyathus striatus]KAF9006461.1 hypothetical protein BDQ17DRAFT_1423347 [Cyathus striatus]